MTTDIAETEPIQYPGYQGESWAELITGANSHGEITSPRAITTKGADLLAATDLVGVPFVITGIALRPGDFMDSRSKDKGYFASLELIAGDEAAFTKARKRKRIPDDCSVDPGERLVFNDGSTGIYRQIVGLMEGLGWITLPEGPEGGPRGESRLDTPIEEWQFTEGNTGVEVRFDNNGRPVVTAPVRVYCERGVRISQYENDYTRDGKTHYLA
jgi:hypothetical protein